MSSDRTVGRNVFLYNGKTGEALGGLEQQGAFTEANLLWVLEKILLVCDAPFTVRNRDTGKQVKPKDRPLAPGFYGIFCDGTMTLTDEPWLPRISCYSVSGLDNNFRDSVRTRDGRCVVSGVVNELAKRGRWDSFEAAHVFPLEWESVWTDEKYSRWVKNSEGVGSIAQMNSPQNGILLTSNLRRWFDQYLFSINPDDNYKITVFCKDIFKIEGKTLEEVCRRENDPNRVSKEILRWHFRQSVLANMRGVGEPTFDTDFPPGSDRLGAMRNGPYGKERLEKALEGRMEALGYYFKLALKVMDVHRCRFVPYNPHAINALAFSHPPSADTPGRGVPTLRLAIGRANGDIEIWNPQRGAWVQETILRGGKDRSIEGLSWTIDPVEELHDGSKIPGKIRLFSIGASEAVTEWDLATGLPARHLSANFGEIWSLSVQPAWKPHRKDMETGKFLGPAEGENTAQHLAIGLADGSIVLLSTADNDLKYVRTMRPSTKRARVLSIAFQNRHTIVAGYADSTIRVYDIRSSVLIRTVSLGSSEGRRELLVWSVKCLPDGGIVSGDSAGEVRFWDARNYSLVQRIQGHQADVLDLAVSADGQTVISGGADQRTAIYKLKGGKSDRSRRWQEIMHRRYHTHDVKAFAVYETRDISIVVSGGLDTIPVVMPLREYGAEHHRRLSSLPQIPQVSSAASTRLAMGWWDREINIWRISRRSEQAPPHKLVGKILLLGEENLSAVTVSNDGSLLVAASFAEVKMFTLRKRKAVSEEDKHALKIHKVELPPVVAESGARVVKISPDKKWLVVVRPNSDVIIAGLTVDTEGDEIKVTVPPNVAKLTRAPRHERHVKEKQGTHGSYDRTINTIAFSSNSRILACGDLSGCVDSWILREISGMFEGKEKQQQKSKTNASDDDYDFDSGSDSEDEDAILEGQRWASIPAEAVLPRNPSSFLFLTFRPQTSDTSASDKLVAITADHSLLEFDVLKGKLSDWSRRNPKTYLPSEFKALKDRAMGALWDTHHNSYERLWLYGPNWIWMFDMTQDFPAPGESVSGQQATSQQSLQKRKRVDSSKPGVNTGAGDTMSLAESYVGIARKMRRVQGADAVKSDAGKWIQLREEVKPDEEEENEASLKIASMRRQTIDEDIADNEDGSKKTDVAIRGGKKDSSDVTQVQTHDSERKWWYTLKYREMLGVLPLSADTDDDIVETETDGEASDREIITRRKPSLEVAIIERPIWDVNLPGRYIRDYE
ncbi:U3 small nucleolar RNA-associated protein [Ascosphaera aggregata]|nr:U3 small nucleolar RNA-associated protein [Ascosphaera aggregata]